MRIPWWAGPVTIPPILCQNEFYSGYFRFPKQEVSSICTLLDLRALKLRFFPLSKSDTCAREPKRGSRPALQWRTSVRRVDSAPGSCGRDIGSLLASHSGSVRVKGKRLCSMFYSLESSDAPLGINKLAGCMSFFPCSLPWPWWLLICPEWGTTTMRWYLTGSCRHAMHWLAKIYCISCCGLSLVSSCCFRREEQSSICIRSTCWVPELLSLSAGRVSKQFICTIQGARASSTRSLYEFKWRMLGNYVLVMATSLSSIWWGWYCHWLCLWRDLKACLVPQDVLLVTLASAKRVHALLVYLSLIHYRWSAFRNQFSVLFKSTLNIRLLSFFLKWRL